jgi:hypothetical protein
MPASFELFVLQLRQIGLEAVPDRRPGMRVVIPMEHKHWRLDRSKGLGVRALILEPNYIIPCLYMGYLIERLVEVFPWRRG